MVPRWRLFGDFWVLYFQRAARSTFETCILNSHIGHTMCRSMVDIQSAAAEIRRGKKERNRMWANAQRNGRPAEYRWRPLFNAANFGWRPLLECRAVTLPRRESRSNWKGCLKLANRSQPLVGRSSPYYKDMRRRYRCLTSFFSICQYMPQLQRYGPTKLCNGAKMAICLHPVFQRAACSTFQTCILNSH